jgi:hypothetical protein
MYSLLTTVTILLHFAFLMFVVGGGLMARRVRWLTIPHFAAVVWGVYAEAMPGLLCPLTGLENALALRAGGAGYSNSFIEHYILPILYPDGLTQAGQWVLAALLVVVNVVIYAWPRRKVKPKPAA